MFRVNTIDRIGANRERSDIWCRHTFYLGTHKSKSTKNGCPKVPKNGCPKVSKWISPEYKTRQDQMTVQKLQRSNDAMDIGSSISISLVIIRLQESREDTHPTLGCPCRCCLCQVFNSTSSAVPQTAIDDRDDEIVGRKRLSWRDRDLDEWKGLDEESLVVVEEEELMMD
jgi:hypothetical protein